MSLEGYTGPTSGRITIGGGKPAKVERFYDKPLTEDERNATSDFRALSPNEQIREVRRLRWNLNEAQNQAKASEQIIREQDAEINRLRAELATHTPHGGYAFPPAARDLIDTAQAHGWKTAHAWTRVGPSQGDDCTEEYARLEVKIGKDKRTYQYTWLCWPNGRGSLSGTGLAWAPYKGWYHAPSLTAVKALIIKSEER